MNTKTLTETERTKGKHTKGKWKVTWSAAESRGMFYLHQAKNAFADELDANARLIASAPELLSALREIVAHWRNGDEEAFAQRGIQGSTRSHHQSHFDTMKTQTANNQNASSAMQGQSY